MTESEEKSNNDLSEGELASLAKTLDSLSNENLRQLYKVMREEYGHRRTRLLTELPIIHQYMDLPAAGVKTYVGAVIDVETTGLKHAFNDVIELSIVGFEFDQSGNIYHVQTLYTGYEDSDIEIPHEVTVKTGLTKEIIAGHKFDDEAINEIVSGLGMVVAHNAGFDRVFLEERFPIFETKHWACSMKDVDWLAEDVDGRSLQALLNHYGFEFKGHRAEIDCYAVIHLMTMIMESTGENVLVNMLDTMRIPSYHVYGYNSDYETKQLFNERNYHWHPGDQSRKKCWHKEIADEKELAKELEFLRTKVYPNDSRDRFGVESIGSSVRYSLRAGEPIETIRPPETIIAKPQEKNNLAAGKVAKKGSLRSLVKPAGLL